MVTQTDIEKKLTQILPTLTDNFICSECNKNITYLVTYPVIYNKKIIHIGAPAYCRLVKDNLLYFCDASCSLNWMKTNVYNENTSIKSGHESY